jgi:ribosomal-protein-alanine N-acetyltransferase
VNEWLGGFLSAWEHADWRAWQRRTLDASAGTLAALGRIGWWPATPPPLIDEPVGADLPVLAELHGAAFPTAWSEAEIASLLAAPGVVAAVARRASPFGTRRPVGFLITRAAADEAEILTLAVAPRWRRAGIGRDLVETTLRRLYADRVGAVFLEVDAGNAAARALYGRLGFRTVGERRAYYASSPGDGRALVMRIDLR